jgi:hypothetical protein
MVLGLAGLIVVAGCARKPDPVPEKQPGFACGKVTLSPLSPVARSGQPPEKPPQRITEGRLVLFYASEDGAVVGKAKVDGEGEYRLSLPPGRYLVKMRLEGIERATGLPQWLEIKSDAGTRLDIDIDTGIR